MEYCSGLPLRSVCRWHGTVDRYQSKRISFAKKQIAVAGLAEPRRIREDGLEHGLQVSWRTADDAKNLGGRRLPLQGFAQLLLQIRIGILRPSRHAGQEPSDILTERLPAHFWCPFSPRCLTLRVAHSIALPAAS